jgi:hypothetical protein
MALMPDHLPDFNRPIQAGGLTFKIDPDDASLEFLMVGKPSRDELIEALADTQQAFSAAKMLYAQLLCHQRHSEHEVAAWDATRTAEITTGEGKSKTPQWRAQQLVKASPAWLQRKKDVASIFGAVYAVDGHAQALQWKMQTLQTILASSAAPLVCTEVVPKGTEAPYGDDTPDVPTAR